MQFKLILYKMRISVKLFIYWNLENAGIKTNKLQETSLRNIYFEKKNV